MLEDYWRDELKKKSERGLLRSVGSTSRNIDFSSNDYLGLSRIPTEAGLPSGATGSRLLTGNIPQADEAEALLATTFGYDRCLIFTSGYMANQGVLSCLPQRGDTILYDQRAHACIKDGARLSQAAYQSFRHNDLDDLERRLHTSYGKRFIVVESIYSMDGDEAPLEALAGLARQYDAFIIVDEAHATAVRGKTGGGVTQELGLQSEMLAVIYTFGKGMGGHGAAVASSRVVRDYLVNFSRPFIYTTGLPPAAYRHLIQVLPHIHDIGDRRQQLSENIRFFIGEWKSPLTLLPSVTSIQAVVCPGIERVRSLSASLHDAGYDVRPILPPTVAKGTERLRICLHSYNTKEEISGLINEIQKHS